ncbi:hypothetical protein PENSPDRAFT_672303 [Peniophora sp. CONT]|nr:hypothetical protein PENSPDRAFT_672303 [Peniophora sp. CONT]
MPISYCRKPSRCVPLSNIGKNSDSDIEVINSRASGCNSKMEENLIPVLKCPYDGSESASKEMKAELKIMQWLGLTGLSGSKTHTSKSVSSGPSKKPHVGLPKQRLNSRQSKLPAAPKPMSAYNVEWSQEHAGLSRHLSTNESKPSRKRNAATVPSEAGGSDIVEIPADLTKLFKMGSWGSQWPQKLKFSVEEPKVAAQTGAFVSDWKPKFKEGPMSQAQIVFMENYLFSDKEFGMSESVAHKEDIGKPLYA